MFKKPLLLASALALTLSSCSDYWRTQYLRQRKDLETHYQSTNVNVAERALTNHLTFISQMEARGQDFIDYSYARWVNHGRLFVLYKWRGNKELATHHFKASTENHRRFRIASGMTPTNESEEDLERSVLALDRNLYVAWRVIQQAPQDSK